MFSAKLTTSGLARRPGWTCGSCSNTSSAARRTKPGRLSDSLGITPQWVSLTFTAVQRFDEIILDDHRPSGCKIISVVLPVVRNGGIARRTGRSRTNIHEYHPVLHPRDGVFADQPARRRCERAGEDDGVRSGPQVLEGHIFVEGVWARAAGVVDDFET